MRFWDRTTWLHFVLSPLAGLYALGWEAYQLIYRLGIKRPAKPHKRIVCVGNSRVGGTGKSPFTLWLCGQLRTRGFTVVLGMSGYGSPRAENAQLAPEGPLDPAEWGDEVALARMRLPDVPIIVGRARVMAAEICAREFPEAILLMDDGFQHMPLAKDVTLVLDPENPPNRFCFPIGPYREPRWNRTRASLILPSGPYRIVKEPRCEGDPARATHLLCALAQPELFVQAYDPNRSKIAIVRPDHDPLTAPDLLASVPKGATIITTAKDWVKLTRRPDADQYQWVVCDYECRIEPVEEFMQWLIAKLG